MSPPAVVILLVVAACMLLLPQRYCVAFFLLGVFIVPRENVLVLAGFNLMPTRILVFVGWIRVAFHMGTSGPRAFAARLNSVDSAFLSSTVLHAVAFTLLWRSSAALANQCGFLWSSLGAYFLLRYLIHNEADVRRAIQVFAVIALLQGTVMVYEHRRGENVFGTIIGGQRATPEMRMGEFRSQGVFGHAITAGTSGATLLPLFLLLLLGDKSAMLGALGVMASAVMVYTSNSSTPVLAAGAAVVGLCFWPLRGKMRTVRWGLVLALLALQLVMNAPVWFLIKYMNVTGTSASYHRAQLVHLFITRLSDWWLVGTKDAGNWGHANFDASNMYVARGQSGGLLSFVFFIAMIVRSYGRIGRARRLVEGSRREERRLWLLGTALFAHVIAFLGISYWDQTEVVWFALLAMISAVTANVPGAHSILEPAGNESSPRTAAAGVDRAQSPGRDEETPGLAAAARRPGG